MCYYMNEGGDAVNGTCTGSTCLAIATRCGDWCVSLKKKLRDI